MLASTPEAAQAITSSHRQFSHRLMVDWNNNGLYDHPLSDMSEYVLRTGRDQALTSTAPEELLLVEGHAAASLDVTLAGNYNGSPLAHHFAPYNGHSVFYAEGIQLGVEVTYSIAVWTINGWQEYPQFKGVVRNVNTDRVSREVRIECLDNVERLRTPVDIPAWGVLQSHLQQGWKRGQLCDSTSLIDMAARTGGFSAGPKGMNTGVLGTQYAYHALSVPFHGSLIPEIGTPDNDQGIQKVELWEQSGQDQEHRDHAEAFFPGPHGYLARQRVPLGESGNYHKYWIDEQGDNIAGNINRTFVLSGWFYWENNGSASTAISMMIRSHRLELYLVANGACRARFFRNLTYDHNAWDNANNRPVGTWETIEGPYSPLPSTTGWHHYTVKFQWDWSTNDIWMQAQLDGVGAAPAVVANRTSSVKNDRFSGLVMIRNTWSVSDVDIWSSYVSGVQLDQYNYDITPKESAVFPSGLWGRNRMTHTFREKSTDAWTLATDIASSEYGAVYFDEEGRFHFHTYDEIRSSQSNIVRSFTVDELSQLSFRYSTDSVRNVWSVTTKAGRVVPGIAYDLAKDGVPFKWDTSVTPRQLYPVVFNLPPNSGNEFFFLPDKDVMCVTPWTIPNIQDGPNDAPGYWDENVPRHGRQTYTGTDFRHNTVDTTESKFISRDLVRFWLENWWTGSGDTVGYLDPNGSARFRIEGNIVTEDQEKTWIVKNDDSAAQFGQRVIELKNDMWLQDEFQTRMMLGNLIDRATKTIPVTDAISAPGDPRLQLGDTVEVIDPDGMGESIKLQILGISRELSVDTGLTDTYQVEVVEPAREWVLGSETYSILGQSTILG